MEIGPKEFWEQKILSWEVGRYSNPEKRPGIVEWIANRSSMSLRFRVRITPELLKPFLLNKRVVEIGCGSGLMARRLIDLGAESYFGIDIAEAAIVRAQQRVENISSRIQFACGGINQIPKSAADIVVSLGLLDWLSNIEIVDLFQRSGDADFLHAIAEKRPGFEQWLHRFYLRLTYGNDAYRPRYFLPAQIAALASKTIHRPLYIYRDRRLSFGALISSLPIGPLLESDTHPK
jgi:SAM-dependent methyltransferase